MLKHAIELKDIFRVFKIDLFTGEVKYVLTHRPLDELLPCLVNGKNIATIEWQLSAEYDNESDMLEALKEIKEHSNNKTVVNELDLNKLL